MVFPEYQGGLVYLSRVQGADATGGLFPSPLLPLPLLFPTCCPGDGADIFVHEAPVWG